MATGRSDTASERPTSEFQIREPGIWLRYITTLAVTFAILFACYGAAIVTLDRVGSLPPPAIVNEICADEKLDWLRKNPPDAPNLLIVGSSLAWRGVDSQQFAQRVPGARPLNGGVCHAGIDQSTWMARYLLRHFPSVQSALLVVAPQDFTSCLLKPDGLFNPETADAYVFHRRWAYPFYITQFDPVSLIRNAWTIAFLRSAHGESESLVMTRFGDGPLNASGNRGLLYGPVKRLDESCFDALRSFARSLEASGRHLFVTTAPLHPAWRERYDPSGDLHRTFVAGVKAAIAEVETGSFWDGAEVFGGEPSEFTDAIHINWKAAQRFTSQLVTAFGARRASSGAAPLSRR